MTHDPSFTVSVERHEPNVLYLHGAVTTANARVLRDAIAAVDAEVVLDLTALTTMGAPLIAAVDAAARRRSLTLRGPSDALDRLPPATLAQVALEPTTDLVLAQPGAGPARPLRRDDASPGTPRREAAGFVSSYGQGRSCAVASCPTMLSRYNPRNVCAAHSTGQRV